MASMGIYVFSRDVLPDTIEPDGATDFGRRHSAGDTDLMHPMSHYGRQPVKERQEREDRKE
jgi:ADP-glucose pyrophosphorylase